MCVGGFICGVCLFVVVVVVVSVVVLLLLFFVVVVVVVFFVCFFVVFLFFVVFFWSLFVPHISFFWCLGKAVLRDFGLSWLSSLIFYHIVPLAVLKNVNRCTLFALHIYPDILDKYGSPCRLSLDCYYWMGTPFEI